MDKNINKLVANQKAKKKRLARKSKIKQIHLQMPVEKACLSKWCLLIQNNKIHSKTNGVSKKDLTSQCLLQAQSQPISKSTTPMVPELTNSCLFGMDSAIPTTCTIQSPLDCMYNLQVL